MAIRVAINGFGRIGRLVFRHAMARKGDIDFVGINDLTDAKTLGHLLKYDSVHGRYQGDVRVEGNDLIVDGDRITISAERRIEDLKWGEIDVVIESTGVFTDRASLQKHLDNGARRVVLTAPAKDELDATVVLGVNDDILTPDMKMVSNASCTTNCLAPMAKVIMDNFGITTGFMTTVHSYTNDQNILDLPHKDLRRARAAAMNIIPTSTGAAKALGLVIPELQGKLDGFSLRVPTPDGSVTDFTAVVERVPTKEEVNAAFRAAAENGPIANYLEYSDDPLVSTDIIGNPNSCIVDALSTMVIGNMVKVVGWYDNEFGYSRRVVDLVEKIAAFESVEA
ncbi:MAG TPA: type I glyceraldehyde-3-phosphate dehydrogenase [Candidatus Kapabacteria bacterium]|nr:type I glyceraldehyde-3-phosphate dehydrogenase [Candidatus Kapabacteria bacterium]